MKNLLLVAAFFALNTLFAQQEIARLSLEPGNPLPEFYEYSPVDKGLVTLGQTSLASSRNLSIIKYDAFLKKQWEKKVLEQNGRTNLDMMTVVNDNILVFVSEFFPKEKVIKTFFSRYKLSGEAEATDELLSVYPNQQEQKVDLGYVMSQNKRVLLAFKDLRKRKEADQILYYLFDDSGELAQNGELNFQHSDDKFSVVDLRVSNDGNIFALGKFYPNGKRFESDNFQYLLYKYDTRLQKMFEMKIDFGVKVISSLAFRLDQSENVYLSGFYSNRSSDKIIGTLFQKLSPEGTVLVETIDEFSEDFKRQFLSKNQLDKGQELRNFQMHRNQEDNGIILRSDGGILLMAERYYKTSQSYRDMYGFWTTQDIHHYEEVILTSIDPVGKIEWHAVIDKAQVGSNPERLSYFNALGGKGVYVMYDYDERKVGNNIYFNVVNMKGEVSQRIPLVKKYKWSNEFYPRFATQTSGSEVVVVYFTRGGKGMDIVKLKLD